MSTNHIRYRLLINCIILALFVPLGNTVIHAANMDKGPYLIYNGHNTQMKVLWQLDATQSCTLEWGTSTSYSDGTVPTTEYGTDHQHKHVITGLTVGTKYYYRVTYGGSNLTGSFTTAPAASATSVKLLAFGDTRSQPSQMDNVFEQMVTTYTADPAYQTICLLSGDWSASNTESSWTNEFFSSSATNAIEFRANVSITGCRGNHEGSGSVYDKYYPYPYVNAFYFSFDYGPVHVAVVDQYVAYTTGTTQYNWLVNDLATSTKPWKIVMFHEPAWSAGGNGNSTAAQTHLQPVFEQYNIPLIIGGHNHFYSRCVVNGVQHITTGGGGAPLYNGSINDPYVVAFNKTYHHCEIDIQGNNLYFNAIKSDGSVIDTFSLVGSGADFDPPEPDPMTFSSPPAATGDSSIAMTATEATDSFSVQYYFDCNSVGCHDSGWQFDRTYEDTSLEPATEYTYTVTARDMSLNQNVTAASAEASATTHIEDTVSPTPGTMTWNTPPNGTSTSTISMTATTASDSSGVEYYFECTAGGGHNSGWQDNPTYVDTGLMPDTGCTYRVKAADKSSNHNETLYSATASGTTQTGPALWTSKAVYAPGEDIVISFSGILTPNSRDWIGLYVDGTGHDSYLTYEYLGTTSGTETFSGLTGDGPYEARLFFNDSYTLEAFFDFTVAVPDATPPSPDPMTFATPPYSAGATSIAMTATTATDDSPVEYYFKNITIPDHNSGWQGNSAYTDTALTTGQVYGYKVRCRDLSVNYNMTDFSAPEFSMAGSVGGTVTVPDIAGYDQTTAEKVIIASGMTVGAWDSAHSEVFAIGRISYQDPAGGTTAAQNDPVDFTVSLGLLADHNDDDMVGLSDLVIVASAWVNTTDLTDFAQVSSQWLDIVVPPLAYWPLDTDARDDSLNGWYGHGTLNGNASFTTDPNRGHCLTLDGDRDYIDVGFILDPADGPFSVCAWVKDGTDKDNIMCQTDGTGTGNIWLFTDSNGHLSTTVKASGSGGLFSTYSGHTDGNWHHVAMVYDGKRRYLYADGQTVAGDSSDLSGSLQTCDGNLYIGANKTLDAGTFWDGLMDNVRIYNKAISSSEIFALYNSELLP